jgi:hypothetical protein
VSTTFQTQVSARIDSILRREQVCWDMASVCLENRDPHGLHDLGVEIEGLRRARLEIEKLLEPIN